MIIVDELPFSFVEKEGFKNFMRVTMPQFHIPSLIRAWIWQIALLIVCLNRVWIMCLLLQLIMLVLMMLLERNV
uniref:Uncharacterized protein n=1 Tax=Solanum lycopersicum TaxID=4081 RepID=A0A3Q7IHG7_SOLLC